MRVVEERLQARIVFRLEPGVSFADDAQESSIILGLLENACAADAPIQDMVDVTAGVCAWSSWHAPTLRQPPLRGKIYESRPEWHSVKRNLFLRLLFGQSWQVSGLLQ